MKKRYINKKHKQQIFFDFTAKKLMTQEQISNVIDNKIFGKNLNEVFVKNYFQKYYCTFYNVESLEMVIKEKNIRRKTQ